MKKTPQKNESTINIKALQRVVLSQFSVNSFEMESGVSDKEEEAYYDAFDLLDNMYDAKNKSEPN